MTVADARSTDWAVLDARAALAAFDVDPDVGLPQAEAARRLGETGPNVITTERSRSLLALVLEQFRDFMVALLVAAAAISVVIGEPVDAVVILVIVVLNALIGTVQGYRADRALAALRSIGAPRATVQRAGRRLVVPSAELVPGDLVQLTAGDSVTADLRLLATESLQAAEAALTGESVPVLKSTDPVPAPEEHAPGLGDCTNLVFRGTDVVSGRGAGVVVATGMDTEIGRIAGLVAGAEDVRTPLQRRLAAVGRRIAVAMVAIAGVIFGAGVLRGEDSTQMVLTAVSLAVAAVPEALPAVVAITLALGAGAMVQHRALARRLPAVETLGSVTHICTDKTGTLTQNRMRVAQTWLPDGRGDADLRLVAGRCNDVRPGDDLGDPTEVALAEYAGAPASGWQRVAEAPFDSERMRMSTVDRHGAEIRLLCKGAPEHVLPRCRDAADAMVQTQVMAASGLRVLAAAQRPLAAVPGGSAVADLEEDLELVGLVGLLDPPRPQAAAAVDECRAAGIVPIMITGDHPETAAAVADLVGIPATPASVVTGSQLAAAGDTLVDRVGSTTVYARVDPAQKIDIVRALQSRGNVVAMTGDGVNDAPALEQADIGVAMGAGGTDVARGAADLVLLDDNFATIVAAIGEGRRIYDNIRRFVRYVLTGNSGEIWTIFLAPLLGLPLPLLPIQILWVNLLTDGLPGLALAREPAESDVMRRPPRPPGQSIFAGGLGAHVVWVGLLIGGLSLAALAIGWTSGSPAWQTMVFTTLVLCQLVHCYAIRSESRSVLHTPARANPALLWAIGATLLLQLAVVYWQPLQEVFATAPLSFGELATCAGLAAVVLVAVEIEKAVRRQRSG